MSTLSSAVEENKQVQRRFISIIKQDKLKNSVKQSDFDIILEGNLTAHGGDGAVDVLLFEGIGGRDDIFASQ